MSALWNFLTNDTWFFVSPLDWLIIILPLAFVLYMGWHSRRYVAQVSVKTKPDSLTDQRLPGIKRVFLSTIFLDLLISLRDPFS